jgi:hypothetical protein
MLSFALTGAAMCWLVHHWTRNLAAGVVAGLVLSLAPWRFSQLDHMQLLGLYGLPLILLFWDRALATGRWRYLVGLTGAFLLQCLCSYYLAYCTVIATALYGAITAVGAPVRRVARAAGALAVAGVAFGFMSLPYLWARESGLIPTPAEATDLALATVPSWRPYVSPLGIFAGVTPYQGRSALALAGAGVAALVGLRRVRPATVLGLLAIGAAGYVLACGPGQDIGEGLYAWLWRLVPGFSLIRIPARFLVLVSFAIASLAGLGWALVVGRLEGTRRWGLTAAVGVLVLWDVGLFRPSLPVAALPHGRGVPAVYHWLAQHGGGEPLLELPVRQPVGDLHGAFSEGRYAYFSTVHWLPQITGRSGYRPLSRLPDAHALRLLAKLTGLRWIVVHGAAVSAPARRRWEDARIPGLDLVAELDESLSHDPGPRSSRQMGAASGKRSEGRRRHSRGAMARRTERAPRSQPPSGAQADGRGHGIGSKDRVYRVSPDYTPEWRAELIARLRGKREPVTFQGTPLAPLSVSDLQAEFTAATVSERVAVGGRAMVRISLRNTGTRTWPGLALRREGLVMLQLAWRTLRDAAVGPFVASLRFTEDIAPGGEATFAVALPVPRIPGRYRLVAEVVQHGGEAGTRAEQVMEVVPRR